MAKLANPWFDTTRGDGGKASDDLHRDHVYLTATMKSREEILASRWIRPFAHLFAHPSLWHLNRRSVPRALALGFFAAFIVPVGQFLLAALLAVPARANVPLAAAATLVTNPLTFPPIYYAAYQVGSLLLRHTPGDGAGDLASGFGQSVLNVSGPIALGLVIFAFGASLLGYLAGTAFWRLRLVQRWRLQRARKRISPRRDTSSS